MLPAGADLIENAGDETRADATAFEGGVDLGVEERDEPRLGVVLGEAGRRPVDEHLEAAPFAVVLDPELAVLLGGLVVHATSAYAPNVPAADVGQ
jgi:hypothetical protein